MKLKYKFWLLLIALAMLGVAAIARPAAGATTTIAQGGNGCANLQFTLPNANSVAPWYCPIDQQISTIWQKDAIFAMIAVLIAFFIAALIFMVGTAARDERIKNFGVGEIYEAIATAIIVGAFLYVCAVLFGYGPAVFVGQINPYATALSQLSIMTGETQNLYLAIFNKYMTVAEIQSAGGSLEVPAVSKIASFLGIGSSWNYGLKNAPATASVGGSSGYLAGVLQTLFIVPADIVLPLLSDALWVMNAEYYLIIFFAVAAIPAFVVPGVIFRAFIPTRGLGGMMIAIGIGFFLIVPSLLAVTYYFAAANGQGQIGVQTAALNSGSSTGALGQEMQNIQSSMSSYWVLTLFFPPTIAGITYAFVVEIAEIIGGASKMSARLRGFGKL